MRNNRQYQLILITLIFCLIMLVTRFIYQNHELKITTLPRNTASISKNTKTNLTIPQQTLEVAINQTEITFEEPKSDVINAMSAEQFNPQDKNATIFTNAENDSIKCQFKSTTTDNVLSGISITPAKNSNLSFSIVNTPLQYLENRSEIQQFLSSAMIAKSKTIESYQTHNYFYQCAYNNNCLTSLTVQENCS